MSSSADPDAHTEAAVLDALRGAQQVAQRPLRFDEYLAEALYGEHGFYSSGGRAGRRGDFLTSPEVGPLFGAVLARWIDAEFARQGAPDDFRVIEYGAGPGTLARSVVAAAPHLAARYVAVETSAHQRESQPAEVLSVGSWPTNDEHGDERTTAPVTSGVVIANELLDNLPFRLAVFDGGWREALVSIDRSGASEITVPAPDEWGAFLPAVAPHGARVPVHEAAADWVRSMRRSLRDGRVLAFDYCTPRTAALALVPWREWLRTYRGHERGSHYLRVPGLQDITTQVCLDQLPEPDAVRTQAQFLQRWGIDELVEEGRREWQAAAARPDLRALRMRSRVREAEGLLDIGGLGGFSAVEWSAGHSA